MRDPLTRRPGSASTSLLRKRPIGRPGHRVGAVYRRFRYNAASRSHAERAVELHPGGYSLALAPLLRTYPRAEERCRVLEATRHMRAMDQKRRRHYSGGRDFRVARSMRGSASSTRTGVQPCGSHSQSGGEISGRSVPLLALRSGPLLSCARCRRSFQPTFVGSRRKPHHGLQ